MWHILGNLIAAILFAILATVAFTPLVLWIRPGEGPSFENLQGLIAVAAIVFVAVLFTPRGKGGFRRGARITAYALLTMPIPVGIFVWREFLENAQDDLVKNIWLIGLPMLAVMLIPVVLGLILMLISRRKLQPKDQSS